MSRITVKTERESFIVELTDGLQWKMGDSSHYSGTFSLRLYRLVRNRWGGSREEVHAFYADALSVVDETVEVTA